MARELYQPHDNLFRKVFSDPPEAAGLLRPNLPAWLSTMGELARSGRIELFRAIVRYVITTQDKQTVGEFGEALRRHVPGPGGDMKTYAEELLQEGLQEGLQKGRHEGRQEGRQEGQLGTIENFLRAGIEWSVIKEATGIDQEAFQALRRRLEESDRTTE